MKLERPQPKIRELTRSADVVRPEAEPETFSSFDPRTDLNSLWYEDVNAYLTRLEEGMSIEDIGLAFMLELFSHAAFDSGARDRLRAVPEVREWTVDFLNKQRDAWYQRLNGGQLTVEVAWPDIANLFQVIPEARQLVSSWQVVNQLQLSDVWYKLAGFDTLTGRENVLNMLRSLMQAWPELQPSIRTELEAGEKKELLLGMMERLGGMDNWYAYGMLAKELLLLYPDQQEHLREKLARHVESLLAQTRQIYPDRSNYRLVERNAVLGAKKAWIDEQGQLHLEHEVLPLSSPVPLPGRLQM